VKKIKLLNDIGVDPSVACQYEILCLPKNIENQSEESELFDSAESITLNKLLKEEGAKCANSYDLSLDSKISENRSIVLYIKDVNLKQMKMNTIQYLYYWFLLKH
jgi:hypothetical protein